MKTGAAPTYEWSTTILLSTKVSLTPPTKSLWTVLPAAGSTLAVWLFQQVAVWKPLHVNEPHKFWFKGHILYCWWQEMITTGFTRTMHVCLLNKPIELCHSTTHFAIFKISLQIFTNEMATLDRAPVTKFMVSTTLVITQIFTRRSPHVLN